MPEIRIVILNAPVPPPYGGIARYLQLALPELAALGMDIRAVSPPASEGSHPIEGVRVSHWEVPSVPVLTIYAISRTREVATLLWWFRKALVRQPSRALRQIAAVLCWMRSGESALDGDSPVVVHAYDWPWAQGAAAVLLARRLRCASMVSTFGELVPHDGELSQVDAASAGFFTTTKSVLQAADLVASMTEHCRGLVTIVGLPVEDVELIPIAAGLGDFTTGADGAPARTQTGAGAEDPLILFVGQIRERKGPQVLIDALPAIAKKFPAARVALVGPDHGYAPALVERARTLGVADRISVVGAVSDAELPGWYAACDVFAFPTLTPIECLGLTFVQAMMSARIPVATRIAGAPEVIRDGVDGYLVEPGDAAELADRLIHVLELSRAEREAMGLDARARAQELFGEAAMIEQLASAYLALSRRVRSL